MILLSLRKKARRFFLLLRKKVEKIGCNPLNHYLCETCVPFFFSFIRRLVFDAGYFRKQMVECCQKKYKTCRPKTAIAKTKRTGILMPASKFRTFCKMETLARRRISASLSRAAGTIQATLPAGRKGYCPCPAITTSTIAFLASATTGLYG